MKRILILTAHPSPRGHTHKIMSAYKDAQEKLGNTVTTVDLYETENQIPFLQFEDIKNYVKHPNVIKFQTMITETDEVVVIHPLWWGGAPAVMKNFFDNVLTSGFAFSWHGGSLNKLLKGKTARVFITCGGPMWLYRLFVIPPFIAVWKYMTLEYCGVKVTDFLVCDRMAIADGRDERIAKYLRKVSKLP